MKAISERCLKMGAVCLMAVLSINIAGRFTGLNILDFSDQAALVLLLALAGFVMTVASVRRDARKCRAKMEALLDAAAAEDTRAKRLCVMASAQIRRCLDKGKATDAYNSVCGRYDIVRNSEDLVTVISSSASLQKNASLLELQQKLHMAGEAALNNRREYEQLLKRYCAIRLSLKTDMLRRLFDLAEYPPKKAAYSQTLNIIDPTALRSKMQICTAWANI